ncbi:serine hydrolase [Bacillus sp. OK048]|uniref:serine hydrolase domain-containing protein n=1 Tax=Bacillus sp. OK048 TaxID=1882761 RepID=UPI000888DD59|nr:serine hydrolase domain-containing protein [Bacillus sp. OK048]SDM85880.1 CubicO group peptidase, beta-lactamase class C family [Bacillus sp. OK048]
MKKIFKIAGIAFVSLMVLGGSAAFATSTTHSDLKGNKKEKVENYVANYVKEEKFSGSILVLQEGKVILDQSYGKADKDDNLSFSNDDLFPVGSLTKSMTAIAILQLEEQGKLSVNDSLSKYFPDLPNSKKITLHQLLNHTSGYIDFLDAKQIIKNYTKPHTDEEILNSFKNEPVVSEPGEKFAYINTGYYLLGKIIEQVSGVDYATYLEKNIFDKAGLDHTFILNDETMTKVKVKGYENGKLAEQIHPSLLFASGNVLSTKEDMVKYLSAIDSNKLITPEQREKMHSFTTKVNLLGIGYGYGWYVANGPMSFYEKMHAHGGSLPGLRVGVNHYQDQDLSIIIFSNIGSEWIYSKLMNGITSILFDKRQWFFHSL